MTTLIAGLVIFLGVHSVRMLAPDWRGRMVARIGLNAWKGLYSLVSIAGFVLVVYGFGLGRHAPVLLYVPPVWARHLNSLFTLVAFVLIAAAYVPRNRLQALLGHPMLAGAALWAFGHLLATGYLHDVVLFGAFLVWALADFTFSRRRDPLAGTAVPAATATGDALAVAAGLVAWGVFAFWLHGWLIGVKPMA